MTQQLFVSIVAMEQNQRKVISPSCSKVSHLLPCSPDVKLPKEFLQHTPVLDMEFAEWKQGVPTTINKENLTPNQEALGLLSGFATGQIHMTGEVVEHLPVTNQDKSIGELLKGLDPTPPKKKKVDGSVNCNKKPKRAKNKG